MSANTGFSVDIPAYSGPFDALLSMIANRQMELTQISLSAITEEFLDYVRGMDLSKNMSEASSFIDVASVLVEAKSVALLPGELDSERDEQSLEALRERDMLFARLVQYRAFKSAASDFRGRLEANAGRHPHPAALDDFAVSLLPELVWTLTADDLAHLAAQVIGNAPEREVSLRQLHVSQVDLQAQAAIVKSRLSALCGRGTASGKDKAAGSMTFTELIHDVSSRLEIVARFLAVLLFFKQGHLQYRQAGPFAELNLRWVEGGANMDGTETGADGVHSTNGAGGEPDVDVASQAEKSMMDMGDFA
ncbi:segregation and condensation protein A [Bifidobacterium bombi DSM 19703]|uniref:Segregation and condensation protein A n=1 Tax=Bifidobacterium bombi DSM 19703 TaxID=1341695 RepID=A0A080N4I8_9BIFI|nr:ScpA family protein [Bifidobacterium bombi]KFF31415.1 segregation and condensation protein A [Bifidobacterium bombi DSM 19703]